MQTINFYLDSYRPKPLSFDSRFALVSIAVSFIGIFIYGWIQASEVDALTARLAERNQQSNQQLEQLNQIKKELASQSEIKDLQKLLANSQKELASYQHIMASFDSPLATTQVDFSQILKDLSQQTVDFLWLTKISIESHNLSLNGSATKAEAIPLYVNKLNQASSLKRYFDELKINRPDASSPKSLQLIEFELLNGKLINE